MKRLGLCAIEAMRDRLVRIREVVVRVKVCAVRPGVVGAAFVLALCCWCIPASAINVDGIIEPYEWSDANVVIWDPMDVPDANYDLQHVRMADGENSLFVSVTVYGTEPALADGDYLNFYFNLYSGGGRSYRLGLTYNDGYGFDTGEMHLVQYYDSGTGWSDLGEPEFAIDEAVEVKILWSMLPAELTSGGAIAVQSLFFLYNVAPGDANADGAVDVGDLGVLAGNYGTVGGAGWANADFNLDGCVDVSDLGILAGHYGYLAPGGATYDIFDENTEVQENRSLTEHTPEPLTILAIGMSIAGLAGYVRKQRRV